MDSNGFSQTTQLSLTVPAGSDEIASVQETRAQRWLKGTSDERSALLKSWGVQCSCGAESIIFFDPVTHEWFNDDGWVFTWYESDESAGDDWNRGWNCNDPSMQHFQMLTEPLDAKMFRYVWEMPIEHPLLFPEKLILIRQLMLGATL